MNDSTTRAIVSLGEADVYQTRLTGIVLMALVERELLTSAQARAMIEDVMSKVPDKHLFLPTLAALRDEFRT